jgi:ATP-dependent helicase/nuclease subunit B
MLNRLIFNMDKIITLGFEEDFISRLADFIHKEFYQNGVDGSRIACVFGGRRPALFLRKALAQRIGNSFIPPRIFSVDSFMEYLLFKDKPFKQISELDACYQIYHIVKGKVPKFLNADKSFNDFMPWAREIISFIEQLDIENVSAESLEHVQKSAEIGYDVPENINDLLRKISKIRQAYHNELAEAKTYSRGLIYLEASKQVQKKIPDEFDKIIFCNFFYLQNTEKMVISEIYRKGIGICFFQGSQDEWRVLKDNAKLLGSPIKPKKQSGVIQNPNLYHGSDLHAQVCLVRDILKDIKDKNNTVIVVPRSESIIPLISEVSSELEEYNISMGYSLKRNALYALFELLYKVQESRKGDKYYASDYLNLLRHPLIKNFRIAKEVSITRVVIHKLEESLRGLKGNETAVTGNIFLTLSEIEHNNELHKLASETLNNMGIRVSMDDCAEIFKTLHKILFADWAVINTYGSFGKTLAEFLDTLAEKSMVRGYSFNLKIMERLHQIADELSDCAFSDEKFTLDEIWDVFRRKMENEMISFSGSPLRGTQILGLLETRALNFKNVIIMDANESILPRLKMQGPLIPREIMLSVGLNRLNKEEEIQRYYFKRLISSAQNVYLIYEENREKEKSRFIEEIIWDEQKRKKKMDVFKPQQAGFLMEPKVQLPEISKTPEIIKYLKEQTYSASRLNRYLECPLSFYYQYVLGVDESENMLDDLDAANIGTFFHELFEEGYKRFINRNPVINKEFVDYLAKRMNEKFEAEVKPRMKADWFLLKMVMDTRLKGFLDKEKERAQGVKKVLELESNSFDAMKSNFGEIRFNYKVDRIDELENDSLLVLDYKTGTANNAHKPKSYKKLVEMEFNRESILENIRSFQLPIYNYFVSRKYPDKKVNSVLYTIRDLELTTFISDRDADNDNDIMNICIKSIEYILGEIFNQKVPFKPDNSNERVCGYCPFIEMC